jgi:hypothetical protein
MGADQTSDDNDTPEAEGGTPPKLRDYFKIGRSLTAIYAIAAIVYAAVMWRVFYEMPPNEFGDFLAGVFGPLFLLWVVLGFLQQGEELKYSREALLLQAKELKASVEAQKNMGEAAWAGVYNAQDQLRAHVYPTVFVPTQHFDPEKQVYWWSFYVDVQNSGGEPAVEADIQISRYISDDMMPDDYGFDHIYPDSPKVAIGPKQSLKTATVFLDNAETLAVMKQRKHFYIWGWVKYYESVAKKSFHKTQFCYKITVMGDATGKVDRDNIVQWTNHLHKNHNSVS